MLTVGGVSMLAFQQYHEIVVVVVRVSVTQNCHDFMAVFDGGGVGLLPLLPTELDLSLQEYVFKLP